MQSSINTTNAQPQMASTPIVTRPIITSVPVIPTAEISRPQGSPMERQVAAILESLAYHSKMISTLQEQLTTLTTEVVKLQQQAPGKKATTEENPPARSRTFSVSSIDSDTSSLKCVDTDQQKSVDISQTLPIPRSKPNQKKSKEKRKNSTSNTPQQPNTPKQPAKVPTENTYHWRLYNKRH